MTVGLTAVPTTSFDAATAADGGSAKATGAGVRRRAGLGRQWNHFGTHKSGFQDRHDVHRRITGTQ